MKLVRYEYPQPPSTSAFNRLFDLGMPSVARFGELFDDFMGPELGAHQPAADLYEDDQNFFARLELPGVKKDAINLELENAVLTFSGSYSEETKEAKSDYRFQRSISVPDGVVLDKIKASYENGILTVTMPKEESCKARQITVK
jgi:HSP20 family protein